MTSKNAVLNDSKILREINKKLPLRIRSYAHSLLEFTLKARELADVKGASHEQRKAIEDYRRQTIAAVRDPASCQDRTLKDFSKTVHECRIPELEIHAFLDAISSDTYKKNYKDMHELQHYMRGSSAAIGYMLLHITGFTGERETVKHYARALSEALRATDMLVSVREDLDTQGRTYLPQSLLSKHGVSSEDLTKHRATPGFRKSIRELLVWTREQYREGTSVVKHLPADCRFEILFASALGLRMLEKIERTDFNPITKRVALSGIEKKRIRAGLWLNYHVLKRSELRSLRLTHA